MKKIIIALVLLLTATFFVKGHNNYNRHASVTVQMFYDDLAPYGDWIHTTDYGYVWRPYTNTHDGFLPYSSHGNWVYTDLGWTWISDYRWGWAPFHYGRWYFDNYLGWMWVPGNEWAPAWVTWGTYNDLWAWAPMGPGMQVSFNTHRHAPHFWWTFVPRNRFCSDNWHAYIYTQPVHVTHINYITNVYYNNGHQRNHGNWYHGPRVGDVEKHLNRRVQRMQLVDSERPGDMITRNNRVPVYRPRVTNDGENVHPGKYRNAESARTSQNVQRTKVPDTKPSRIVNMAENKVKQPAAVTRTPGNEPRTVRTIATNNETTRNTTGKINSRDDQTRNRTETVKNTRRDDQSRSQAAARSAVKAGTETPPIPRR